MTNGTANPFLSCQVDMAQAMKDGEGPLPWVVDQLVLAGSVTLLVARAGIGKTWLSMDMCRAVSSGTTVLGLQAEQGRAVYLDWENGPRRLGRRFNAMGLAPDAFDVFYTPHIHLKPSDDARVAAALRDLIRTLNVKLVVIDSLRRLSVGARENESDDMVDVVGRLGVVAQETNAAICVIHHAKKEGGFRGSGTIEDSIDAGFMLTRKNAGAPVDVECFKHRDDAMPEKFSFRLVASDGGVSLEPLKAPERPAPQEGLEALKAQVSGFLATNPSASSADVKKAVGGNAQRVTRALNELVADGFVAVRDLGSGRAKQHTLVRVFPPPPPAPAERVPREEAWPLDCHDEAWSLPGSSNLTCAVCHPPAVALVERYVKGPDGRRAAA